MNKQLNEIFQKRMDRKDFLKHVGIGVAVITGTAGIIKYLKPDSKAAESKHGSTVAATSSGYGYGGSAYGGNNIAQKSGV